eukprot:TRINITY_DN1828_c0_g1_i4.p3 TRINITY_DN1828_c0_g1~~TRINITY_DN1828_c0_g1_i4.p3  ORF type:complete len:188 (+),score=42.25 TRINITY_DN1828_c0_g1_i4:1176-1739(+)
MEQEKQLKDYVQIVKNNKDLEDQIIKFQSTIDQLEKDLAEKNEAIAKLSNEKEKYQYSINNLIEFIQSSQNQRDSMNCSSIISFLSDATEQLQLDSKRNSQIHQETEDHTPVNLMAYHQQQREDRDKLHNNNTEKKGQNNKRVKESNEEHQQLPQQKVQISHDNSRKYHKKQKKIEQIVAEVMEEDL